MGYWLLICLGAIFLTIVLGAATRLTGSGLSMTDLRILGGMVPPMGAGEWEDRFGLYQKTPEYELTYSKKGMDLEGFKSIFWLEYLHRLVGRFLAGFVFLIPMIYFLVRYFKRLEGKLVWSLVGVFCLGGLQAFFGWLMVKSGLDGRSAYIEGEWVRVSPNWLVLHLGLAFLIYGSVLWLALRVLDGWGKAGVSRLEGKGVLRYGGWVLTSLIFLAVLLGGLMAGTNAGLVYQTFPLMGGQLIPSDLWAIEPWWENIFKNKTTIQFQHRLFGVFILGFTIFLFLKGWRLEGRLGGKLMLILWGLLLGVIVQIGLGFVTLLSFVPREGWTVFMGVLHQSMGLVLWTMSFWLNHEIRQ